MELTLSVHRPAECLVALGNLRNILAALRPKFPERRGNFDSPICYTHELIQILRTVNYCTRLFKNLADLGHSYGSYKTNAITVQHPDDLDAAVLTGLSSDPNGFQLAFSVINLAIA